MPRDEPGLFAALLRHWRTRRGLSQLDLALAAEVSSRHVSFLETGRAQPSRAMVLRLGAALGLPLRDQNVLLTAAGFSEQFAELDLTQDLPPAIQRTVDRMLLQQEPFPMTVVDRHYNVLRSNQGAERLLSQFVLDRAALGHPPNVLELLFNPRLCRPFVIGWETVSRELLARLQREQLARPNDRALGELLGSLRRHAGVKDALLPAELPWPSEPTLTLRFRRADLEVAFLTTVTVFNAPQNVTLDELRIDSFFPLDDHTAEICSCWASKDR
jgi:transcriptional regulator with XRE-family HTH domain